MKKYYYYLKALFVALNKHWSQIDKGGNRYFYHPLYVSRQVKGIEVKTIALLHDIIEDTNLEVSDLLRMGFSEYVINGVKCLTKGKYEPYKKYLRRLQLANHKGVLQVKIEDLKHNMQLSRLETVSNKDIARNKKYAEALKVLKEEI